MASSPVRSGSTNRLSEKFCAKNADRTIVHSAPESCTACSASRAPSSPRPESSTSRVVPAATAVLAKTPTVSAAPGNARSGAKARYAAAQPASAGSQVERSFQSKGGVPRREPTLVG